MPSLIQRFTRARNSSGGDDLPTRPKTSAEELTAPSDAAAAPPLEVSDAQTGGDSNKAAADSADDFDAGAAESHQTTDPNQVTVGEGDSEEQRAVDPEAAAAAIAELRKASQKAKAAAALKKLKARSGFSLWNWLPTFYDPIEDTIRSRIIAVLAVAVIPAMLTGLLLEPMITDVADVTQNRVILLSPLFMPMDPMYIGVPPAKGYEFRFAVRNSKYWPQPGVTISASIRPNSTVFSRELQQLLPSCDPARLGSAHSMLAGACSAALDGETSTSDAEGVVVFDKLKFRTALPGTYQIVFSMKTEQAWSVPDIIEVPPPPQRVTSARVCSAIASVSSPLQWVTVLSSTAAVAVEPLDYRLFDLSSNFSSSSGLVSLPTITVRVSAVPGLSGMARSLRILAMEGSAGKLWAEANGKAPYISLESIGAEAGVLLLDNVVTVTSDAAYALSVKVSAWAQPAFMLLAVCDGVIAVVDAAPPSYLKRGVMLPPPVFTMPQLVLPPALLTFDTVAFPSSLLEGAMFSMKVTVPAAGLPASLSLQAVAAASSAHANDMFKNTHPASSSGSDVLDGAFKSLIGNVFSSCTSGTIQGTAVRICSFSVGFSVGGIAMPYKIIVAGLGGALIGSSAPITIRPIISNVHVFPSLVPQLFDSRAIKSTIQISQRYAAPSLPFISAASSYTPLRGKHAFWSLVSSSGPATVILRTVAAPTGVGGGLELKELTLMSASAALLSDTMSADLTLAAVVDEASHSLPLASSAVVASSSSIQAVMRQCGVTKAGWVSATVPLAAEVALAGTLDGPVARVLDFQGNPIPNMRVCLRVGAFYNSSVVACGSSDFNGTARLPVFVLPSVRLIVGAVMPWHLVAFPLHSSTYEITSACVKLAGYSFDDMQTQSAVMFSGLGFLSCQICGTPAPPSTHHPIISMHPSPQPAVSLSGGVVSVYVHSNSTSPVNLNRFPNAVRADNANAAQQEVHVLLQCRRQNNFVLLPSVTQSDVIVPCPVRDGSSSNSSDGAWIQLLQLWDSERFFHPLPFPDAALEASGATASAAGVPASGVLSWSVTSAAASGTDSAATLMSVVLERPESSLYVVRVRMGAATSPLIYLVFPSSITAMSVIMLIPSLTRPYLLLYGRQLSINVTVDMACDSQPSTRCRKERAELIVKSGSTVVPVFSAAVSSMPQRGFLINPIQNVPVIYPSSASITQAVVRLYPGRLALLDAASSANLRAYTRPLQPPVAESLIENAVESVARIELVINGTGILTGELTFVTSARPQPLPSPQPLLSFHDENSAASSPYSSSATSFEAFSIFNPLPGNSIRVSRSLSRGALEAQPAHWNTRQVNAPVFCVVVDRSLAAGGLLGGTVADRALGDDGFVEGGLGVEWRVTAEAVTSTLQQGSILPSALGSFPFTGITSIPASTSSLPSFNLPPHRDVFYTTPYTLPLLLLPGVYSLWGRVVSHVNSTAYGEFKQLAKLEVSNVVQSLEFMSVPSVMVVGVTYTVVIRAVGHAGSAVSGALILLQAFSNTGTFITACGVSSRACAATTSTKGIAVVLFTPLTASGPSHSLIATSGAASTSALASLSIAPAVASLSIVQPLAGNDALGYAAVSVTNASKVSGAILASGDIQADLQGIQLPELSIADVYGRPINQLRADFNVYPGEVCSSFTRRATAQRLYSVTFRTVRYQASKQSYIVDGIQFHPNGTDTGMYCAVYECSGLFVAQTSPFIVRNAVAPDPIYISQLRTELYLGILSIIFTFNANLVSSSYISFIVAVGASGFYALLTILYADAEIKMRGGVNGAPFFNQGTLAVMLLVVVLLAAYSGILLVLWLFKTDFFDDRQSVFRSTLKSIFLKDKIAIAAAAAAAREARTPKSSSKVLPSIDPKAALAAAKLRMEALKQRTWRQHVAAARDAAVRFVNWVMGIPPGSNAETGMFFVPVRFLSAAVVSLIGVFVYILVAESAVRWVFTTVYQIRALVINDHWAVSRFSAASTLGNVIASPAYPLLSHRSSMHNKYDVWAVVYSVLRNFGQDVSKVDAFATSVQSACSLSFVAAFGAYAFNWVMMARSYRNLVLSIRMGEIRVDSTQYYMTDASAYVGRQLWSSIASLLLLQLPLSLIIFIFIWGPSRNEVFSIGLLPIAILVACEAIMAGLRLLIRRFYLIKNLIKNRTMFSLYELIGTFLHLPGGTISTVIRFCVGYFDMALAFGRLDVAISPAQPAKDQGHAAYMAAVLCDIKFNSPFVRYGSFARSRNVIYCATAVTFTLSVLAHDVSGLLNKSRRKRAQLGSALEKDFERTTAALERERHSRCCRNQWMQLYTMMSNKQLIAIRSSTLEVKAKIDKMNAQMLEATGGGIAAMASAKSASKIMLTKVRASPKL